MYSSVLVCLKTSSRSRRRLSSQVPRQEGTVAVASLYEGLERQGTGRACFAQAFLEYIQYAMAWSSKHLFNVEALDG